MLIRSDEAKTWRYRGKNVNQLKSLTLKAFSRPVLYTRGIMDQLSNDLCQTDGRTKVLTWPSCQVWLSLVCCPTNGHDTQTEGRLTLEKYILSFVIVSLPIFTLKDQFNILADKVLYFYFNIYTSSSRMYLYLYICNITRMFFPVNTASGLTKVMCLTFATFFFGSVLHKCTRTICHLS